MARIDGCPIGDGVVDETVVGSRPCSNRCSNLVLHALGQGVINAQLEGIKSAGVCDRDLPVSGANRTERVGLVDHAGSVRRWRLLHIDGRQLYLKDVGIRVAVDLIGRIAIVAKVVPIDRSGVVECSIADLATDFKGRAE